MIYEFGKKYIVDVTEKGIIPLMEFDKDRWYDKDYDELEFLTDEEKVVVINTVLDRIKDEIEEASNRCNNTIAKGCYLFCLGIIDKYKTERTERCKG